MVKDDFGIYDSEETVDIIWKFKAKCSKCGDTFWIKHDCKKDSQS